MKQDVTFILGVGAQKAGTSWLHDHLSSHSSVSASYYKELHFFDAMKNKDWFGAFDDVFVRDAIFGLSRWNDPKFDRRVTADALTRVAAIQNPTRYFSIFKSNLSKETTHFIDTTPSYSTLDADSFKFVRSFVLSHCSAIRVVFLMRDPVERLISAIAHMHRPKPFLGHIHQLRSLAKRLRERSPSLQEILEDQKVMARGRYDLTVSALLASFEPDELYFGFYETLFSSEEMSNIEKFLGLPAKSPDIERTINVSRGHFVPNNDEIENLRHILDPVYRYCRTTFGSTIPATWR